MAIKQEAHSVLLLDDDQSLLDAFRMTADLLGDIQLLCIQSMGEVLSRAKEVLACDSAILDINLGPGQPSGIDVYHWLRSKGFDRSITFLTGHGKTLPEVTEALKLSDAKVYSKPIDLDLFFKVVRGNGG